MIFGSVERLVAWRYLRPRRQEGFVSLIASFAFLGILLGVGTLIVVLAVMNGFRDELMGRILGFNGHANVISGPAGIADFDSVVGRLRQVNGVISVMPYVEGQVMASANEVSSGAVVRGVRPHDLAVQPLFNDHIVLGRLDSLGQTDTAVIGSRMAGRMGLTVGSNITLISPQGAATAFGTIPRVKTFKVGAIYEVGMYEYDNAFVFIPLADAQAYFQLDDRANAIEIKLDDPERIGRVAPSLQQQLGSGPLRLVTWQQMNLSFFTALEVERNVMFLILTLIIIVAAFNIITGLTMLVRSKARDIAILRTIGASRGSIMRIFFLAGASIGIAGTLAGFLVGLAFATNIDTIRMWLQSLTGVDLWSPEIRFLSQLPARVEFDDTLRVVLMGVGLSFLATLYPAFKAARTDPVEALRYE
ncbi:lipoprotein-releasing system permease protein [Arboricoccus pini]|uniref:Lipoprotein-releasing system permease protein n=1 Tax=Arboricoccus pini TaxID=1963835 RepID=A0A212RC42_9PROT|nr:lipoprotein-releasing ABC transporter permease subunit [Arboricoccus pini]SNB69807.1 lipoprotein-releasing system permease protein [Arboricoccus pini]